MESKVVEAQENGVHETVPDETPLNASGDNHDNASNSDTGHNPTSGETQPINGTDDESREMNGIENTEKEAAANDELKEAKEQGERVTFDTIQTNQDDSPTANERKDEGYPHAGNHGLEISQSSDVSLTVQGTCQKSDPGVRSTSGEKKKKSQDDRHSVADNVPCGDVHSSASVRKSGDGKEGHDAVMSQPTDAGQLQSAGNSIDETIERAQNGRDSEAEVSRLCDEQSPVSDDATHKRRPISISLCTSAQSNNVSGLLSYLEQMTKEKPDLIKEVKIHQLPYNDLDSYRFPKDPLVDVMLLCHSINNRRFAITDVMDALYDKYLPYCTKVIGKEKMAVIVHDFDDLREEVNSVRMKSFQFRQPTAFQTTSLQITCGRLDKGEDVLMGQILSEDRENMNEFFKIASLSPEKMKEDSSGNLGSRIVKAIRAALIENKKDPIPTTSSGSDVDTGKTCSDDDREKDDHINRERKRSGKLQGDPAEKGNNTVETIENGRNVRDSVTEDLNKDAGQLQNTGVTAIGNKAQFLSRTEHVNNQEATHQRCKSDVTRHATEKHPPVNIGQQNSIHVFSMSDEGSVIGLISFITGVQGDPSGQYFKKVVFHQLPKDDPGKYVFSKENSAGLMILCHSKNRKTKRGFYDHYLRRSEKVFGKERMVVIVHDVEMKPTSTISQLESFRKDQATIFTRPVITCGSLHTGIAMLPEDILALEHSVMKMSNADEMHKRRPISVSLCTSAQSDNVSAFLSYMEHMKKEKPDLIQEVKIHQLPYNDLDSYRFPEDHSVDVMLLCHSINNRSFAITNVMGALYDEYLPYCQQVIGKEKMAVIVHDFDDMKEEVNSVRFKSFQCRQPTAFQTTSLQITCGRLDKGEEGQILLKDREKLYEFFNMASTYPDRIKKDSSSPTKPPRSTESRVAGAQGNRSTSSGHVASGHPGQSLFVPQSGSHSTGQLRAVSVSICTSANEQNVQGLVSRIKKLQEQQPSLIGDVRPRRLPCKDLDSFKFDPDKDPVDVMVLCHSVHDKGFSITTELYSLYEKYLEYCYDVLGKKKLAVIVHDFSDLSPGIQDLKMTSSRSIQPLTFELVDTVIICGRLDKGVSMSETDWEELVRFFQQARREPREMKQSVQACREPREMKQPCSCCQIL